MSVVAVALLAVGVSGTVARPWRVPAWVFPVAAAVLAVSIGVLRPAAAWSATRPLTEPILFLLLAVPLATLLDDMNVFEATAQLFAGRRLCAGMWLISGIAVAVLNLDAAVVLCTPLAVMVARRHHVDPVAMAFQPALLACLASSALPVSNLTNLIAIAEGRVTSTQLILGLGPPTLVACAVGYFGWRVAFRGRPLEPTAPRTNGPPDRAALTIGGAVLVVLLAGFLLGRMVGIPPWVVVGVVDVALALRCRRMPWSAIPWGTAGVATGLAIVATAAAERTGLTDWLATPRTAPQALLGAGSANVLNNLPAFLLTVDHTRSTDQVLALLLGVNLGPTIVITGSLAGLLWLETARRCGLDVGPRQYARVGLIAGLPALLAAVGVLAMLG
jgi:arsenical pump membrane protein